MKEEGRMIYIYYDRQCGFCSGVINGLLKLNRRKDVKLLDIHEYQWTDAATYDSLVLVRDTKILFFSDAALEVMKLAGGIYSLCAKIAGLLPRKYRDNLYKGIAKNRYRFFGKITCRLS
jgi:predicted DCC family thiol-disulfide oxidoreductase YuxK